MNNSREGFQANAEALLALIHESDLTRVLDALGFKWISRGSFKDVFASKEYGLVVKRTYYGNGYGNRERQNYATAPDHIRPLLVPILAEHESIQIQEYLHDENSLPCRGCSIREYDLTDIYSDSGNGYNDSKNHRHRPDGSIAIYDYGQECQWPIQEEETA